MQTPNPESRILNPPLIFDRKRIALHRERARTLLAAHDALPREAAARLADRLADIRRRFASALDLSGLGFFAEAAGMANVTSLDGALCEDERLPFAPESFELVVAPGGLHWVNDLPGMLVQIRRVLAPGGLFLALLPGGETLKELRASLAEAELAARGGISPRVSPFIDVQGAASLLQRAGFAMPVADGDTVQVEYESPLALMRELRGMGEASALISGPKYFTPRGMLFAAMEHYAKEYAGDAGRIVATAEFVAMTGWKD